VPARANGTVETRWGALPTYKADKGNPLVLNPQRTPVYPSSYKVEVDLLVERDGTVRDVALRNSSGIPQVDKGVTAEFKDARSRLVLAPTDPAPYVIRYALALAVADNSSDAHNDYHFVDDRPMGTGAPNWGKP